MELTQVVKLLLILWGAFCLILCGVGLFLFTFAGGLTRRVLSRLLLGGDADHLRGIYQAREGMWKNYAKNVASIVNEADQVKQEQEVVLSETLAVINRVNGALDLALEQLPPIPNEKEFFATMPKKVKDELFGLPLASVLVEGTAQITAQKLAGIRKLAEYGQRLSIHIENIKLNGVLPAGLEAQLEIKRNIFKQLKKDDKNSDHPVSKMSADILAAQSLAVLMGVAKPLEKMFEPTFLIKAFMEYRAKEERLAQDAGGGNRVIGLDEQIQGFFETAMTEMFVNQRAEEGSSMSKNGNGKGKHQ